ncbi:hypothetical protein BHE74_00031648 [Ensete ventricosum]|nr:hypothetical protein GW17_00017432 [Ensete ventricosum]RWW61305.1 hypothetical protein BHE74_00031648 [Ensete ventricosum]
MGALTRHLSKLCWPIPRGEERMGVGLSRHKRPVSLGPAVDLSVDTFRPDKRCGVLDTCLTVLRWLPRDIPQFTSF